MIQTTGVPIDRYSFEEVEMLRDTQARWNSMCTLRNSKVFKNNQTPELEKIANTSDIDLCIVDAAFDQLKDQKEYEYLNGFPTSFYLPPEAVDRLKAAAQKMMKKDNLRLVTTQ